MQRGLYMNCATADSYLVSVSVAVSGVADSWQCTTDSAFTLWASISGTADSLLPPSPQWLAALPDVGRTITNAIKAEMQLHTSTGNRGTCLEKVQHQSKPSVPSLLLAFSVLSYGLSWLTTRLTRCVFCAHTTWNVVLVINRTVCLHCADYNNIDYWFVIENSAISCNISWHSI